MNNLPNTDSVIEKIKDVGGPNWIFVPLSHFDRQDRVSTKLIENENVDFTVKATSRNFIYEFQEPIYIDKIEIHVIKANKSRIEGYFEPVDSNILKKFNISRVVNKNHYSGSIKSICDSFRFKPTKSYVTSPDTISKIRVIGTTIESLGNAAKAAQSFESIKEETINQINAATQKANTLIEKEESLLDSVAQLQTQKDTIDGELKDLEIKRGVESDALGVLEAKIGELTDRETRINSKIDLANSTEKDKSAELDQIRIDIASQKTALRELEAQANLFPSEFSGYVKNAEKTVTLYWKLSCIPIIALSIIAGFVLMGAVDLTVRYSKGDDFDLIALLASRLPFAIIVAALASAFFKLAQYLIKEIIRIGQQQLAFTRLSVIAKEVNDASKDGLNLDDEQIVEARNHLRMELVKNHLGKDLTSNFQMQKRFSNRIIEKISPSKKDDLNNSDGEDVGK